MRLEYYLPLPIWSGISLESIVQLTRKRWHIKLKQFVKSLLIRGLSAEMWMCVGAGHRGQTGTQDQEQENCPHPDP